MVKNKSKIVQSTSSPITSWHQDLEQQKSLVNLINTEGHVLEDGVISILDSYYRSPELHTRKVYSQPLSNERIEIDGWIKMGKRYDVYEVKKSVYDWVFLKGSNTPQHFHMLKDENEGLQVRGYPATKEFILEADVVEVGFEILVDQKSGGQTLQFQTTKPIHHGLKLPFRPSEREIIRPAVKQILKNVETLIHHEMQWKENPSPRPTIDHIFIPIIVTNAPLYVATYNETNVDDKADLISLNTLNEKPWILFNHQEIMNWNYSLQQTVHHIGLLKDCTFGQPSYEGSHIKSVYIVNHKHLKKFLER